MSSADESPPSERRAWITMLVVIGLSLAFGLVLLPRLGPAAKNPLEGQSAPDFALDVIAGGDAGNRLRLSHLAGKVVILDFWASWCGPCREQAPIVEQVGKAHGADVVAVGVATSDERDDALGFVRSAGLAYTMVFDEGTRVAAAYGVRNLPTVVVVSKGGKVTAFRERVLRREELEKLVELALADVTGARD